MTLDPAVVARALGGDVCGDEVLCPGPGHSNTDRSLSVRPDSAAADGFLVHSFADDDPILCRDFVRTKLGLPPFEPKKKNGKAGTGATWTVLAEHIYRDEHGAPFLLVKKCRDGAGKKQFPQYHWDGTQWVKGKPLGPRIPYRLPELLAAPRTTIAYVCEGEKDCDNLAQIGFVATTASEGASAKWTPELTEFFRDRRVVILLDADDPGRKHGDKVARAVSSVATSVKIIDLFPERNDGSDVSDWLETDRVGVKLIKAVNDAPHWEPGKTAETTTATAADQELIAKLAVLSRVEYAKGRKGAAEKIGIPVTELDKIVKEARGEPEPETLERWRLEPWEEPVLTADLLDALRETYKAYAVLQDHGAATMALWVLHAWAIDAAYVSPFLMFTSPVMRCGKSTALALLYRTGPRTARASNITPSAIFRYIETYHPTLIIDEADTFARDDEAMRGILNSGHTRDTACVIRCEGEDNRPKEFSTWAPKVIAGIGKLAATLHDRSITIAMRRKMPSERVAKLRAQDTDAFVMLRRKALRWTGDNLEQLKAARPKIPEVLNDRAADNWEPLLAIAELAGGEWPTLAQNAATALSKDVDGDTIKTQLLVDIRTAFGNLEQITTKALVEALIADESKPWGAFGKAGKPITGHAIARLLKDFGIRPGDIWIEGASARGYRRSALAEAWDLYVPAQEGSKSEVQRTSTEPTTYAQNEVRGPELSLELQNEANPLKDNKSSESLTLNPPAPGRADPEPCEDRTCIQCRGRLDGTEQLVAIGGQTVWLHPQCARFYLRALEQREGLR